MEERNLNVIVLAGPNGAGKTTAARTLLAESLRLVTFVNADVIAQGLAGFDPDSAVVEASRIMLERLHLLAGRREDFAFETTLAARTYRQRYTRSLRNLFALYLPLANTWQVYDNTQAGLTRMIAFRNEAGVESIGDESLWAKMQEATK